ncbi:hypothetical protein GCM10009090_37900 [[Pseudomonas] boreopolis]|uniref:Sulfatase-modifying factor enzyme-like domain-containing protein n=1 Tax=Xanthomonas boreopolis TaxID=86183 RepID=A0A919FDK1_9XANT|nr:hypothetical protein GCM10009090_37900 [[Pseudomonas] boreopolis]
MLMRSRPLHTLALLPALLSLGACQAATGDNNGVKTEEAKDIASRLEALKQKTLNELIPVKGGTFTMGDFGPIDPKVNLPYSSDTNDDVLREVILSDYAIAARKVTYADYDVYTDATGQPRIAQAEADLKYRNLPGIPAGVDWYGAQKYCHWIGQEIGRKMDLPTEAQWEFAARNRGQEVVWPTDTGEIEDGRNVGSFDQIQSFRRQHGYIAGPTSVGQYPPTPLGLYDMIDHGFEWARDWYAPAYDPKDLRDPLGPPNGTEKVQRGNVAQGGDSLGIVSMTFTRFHMVPSPPAKKGKGLGGEEYEHNQNSANTFRCVAEGK